MDNWGSAGFSMGLSAVASIVLMLICIGLSWWGLQQVRWDLFLKNPKSAPGILLLIFLSISLGYTVASFVSAYFGWSVLLKSMF